MSAVRPWIDGVMGVLVRDLRVFFSYRARVFSQMIGAFFSLALFYYISRLVSVASFPTHDAYYSFAVVGLVILQVLNSTLLTPPMLMRQELVAGTFERVVVSPLGAIGISLGLLLFPFLYSLFTAVVMLAIASIGFGLDLHWDTAAIALPLSVLGTLAFAPFGVLVLALVLVFKQAQQGTAWLVAGISLLAGLYFPVSELPDWARWAAEVQPFTPAVDLLRDVLVGTPLREAAWVSLAKLGGFVLLMWPLSLYLLRGAVRTAQRRGTIIEY